MMLEKVQDWMFFGIGGLWLIVGAVLFVRALWADRSRGRRRCPRCWYDMRGTPGMRCSECGHEARRERELFHTRRRRGVALCGVMLVLLGVSSTQTPEVRRNGWLAIVPTEVLLRYAPSVWDEPKWTGSAWVEDPVSAELRRRDACATLSERQWRYVLEKKDVIKTRKRWPANVPLAVGMRVPSWAGYCEISAVLRGSTTSVTAGKLIPESCGNAIASRHFREANEVLGPIENGTSRPMTLCTVRFAPSGRSSLGQSWPDWENPLIAFTGGVELPVQLEGSINEVMKPVQGAALDEALKRIMQVTCSNYILAEHNYICVNIRLYHDGAGLDGIALGFIVNLEKNREKIETAQLSLTSYMSGQFEYLGGTCSFNRKVSRDSMRAEHWTIKLTGDGEMALRDWDRDQYWAGELTYPLDELLQ